VCSLFFEAEEKKFVMLESILTIVYCWIMIRHSVRKRTLSEKGKAANADNLKKVHKAQRLLPLQSVTKVSVINTSSATEGA